MPSVGIYVRVSTADQNCSIQMDELRGWCARHDWTIYHEYQDQAVSGGKSSRPALDRLMADARAHRFDIVIVTKLDRFGRSVVHLTQALAELDRCGIRFIATQQGLDTDKNNPTSRLLLHILAAVAEFERELIRDRTTAGVRHAIKNGTRSGKAVGRQRVLVDSVRVRELSEAGKSIREIGAELGVSYGRIHDELNSQPLAPVQNGPLD